MEHTSPIRAYRWVVFLAAAFYLIHSCIVSSWAPGGPFRYLTIWALALSLIVAIRVLRISYGKTTERLDGFVSAVAVVNAMVVLLYWRLYFADPTSVTRNGELGDWWREGYMHALGPVLMWIDALFFNRVFTALKKAVLWMVGIIVGYLAWTELFVQTFNDSPVGKVTTGLPYPFLNNLEFADRAVFYGTNIVVAVALLAVFAALAWIIRRLL